MFVWCELPGGVDAADVARAALAQGVVLAPGDVFSVSRTATSRMRFNVSQCPAPVFDVLRDAIRQAGG
jgi:transcriptional regulator, GntR family